ncbi:uncharacterized protein METZ01_LOCUS86336, partial [marine metagenome]
MKIGFWGTPSHAAEVLGVLLNSELEVRVVYAGPDRELGRGRTVRMGPVKRMAVENDLPVFQPEDLTEPGVVESLREAGVDLCVVA